MGQKLSELRGFMITMDNGDDEIGAIEDDKNPVGNGNKGEADEHFEMIYSCRNEPSTSEDALNGNVANHDPQCPALDPQCTCAVKCKAKSHGQGGVKKKVESVRTVSFPGKKKTRPRRTKERDSSSKKRNNWGLRLNCARLKSTVDADIPESSNAREGGCVCTGYRRTDLHHGPSSLEVIPPVIDLARFNPEDFPIEDCDERARMERAREMAEGVDPPPGFQLQPELNLDSLAMLFQTRLALHAGMALSALSHIDVGIPPFFVRMHSQADFIHCLVPDLQQMTASSFYWGKMNRYEAERLLEGRPEGTFLLRDSAQEEHLFSVSFRKYGRSLHARIEQWNHRFSFDSHDPGVFSSPTVCGLIEHYKDSSFCMFFEPMLTISLHRNFPFPLQHLCRSVLCSMTDYDSINKLPLPKCLKSYLREYHYKQRVRVRNLDTEL